MARVELLQLGDRIRGLIRRGCTVAQAAEACGVTAEQARRAIDLARRVEVALFASSCRLEVATRVDELLGRTPVLARTPEVTL